MYEWSNKFKNGLNSVADSHRPGQAHRVVTAVEALVRENRRIIQYEIVAILKINHGSGHQIIPDNNFQKGRRVTEQLPPNRNKKFRTQLSAGKVTLILF